METAMIDSGADGASLSEVPLSGETDGGLAAWPMDPRERCDFYHRIRSFPADVASWRKAFAAKVMQHPEKWPGMKHEATVEEIRQAIDDGISYLREISRITAILHGTPRLGNKMNPVDELVYIILARKTRETAYQQAFDALKHRFNNWDDLLMCSRRVVEKLVYSGGLTKKRTQSLFGALERLREEFGSCTLEPARAWSDKKLADFLCSLPEISIKSAYCIMMYSFGRDVFPVDTHVGRVLTRLGPYREMGLSLQGLHHKQLQIVLADLIPPRLRYPLHVNLLVHGREVCKSVRPLCHLCDLRNFCSSYRSTEAKRTAHSSAPTIVDLFAGAGGLSEGFRRAGFRVLVALDQDDAARRTYWLNHPEVPDEHILGCDVRDLKPGALKKLTARGRVDVLIGAPPCQGFSHAGFRSRTGATGYRIASDERNYLFEYMMSAARELRPALFLMENVPGMHSARQENTSFLEMAARKLEQIGKYRSMIWKLNASAFGVPQDRIRCFLVASRMKSFPALPQEEYQDIQRASFDVDALPPITLDEAIFDLPPLAAGEGNSVEKWDTAGNASDPRNRRYLTKFGLRGKSPLLLNHTVRYNNERDLELYALLKPGENSVHALERYGRGDLMRYRLDAFDDKYSRLRSDRPCRTIVSHLAKDGNGYIHPSQVRTISIREACRVQSFHDGYVFCGAASDQWTQIGNAVPPVLAEIIARSFARLLGREKAG